MLRLQVNVPSHPRKYEVIIDHGNLYKSGTGIRKLLGPNTQRLALISNKKVFKLYGAPVVNGLEASGFQVTHWLMGDGESHKSLRTLERAIKFLGDSGLERLDGVVALGGGVTGDLAGFAAATYLRGIALIHIPTTLVAQIDSSIGGKVGVNLGHRKNHIGAFHQPIAVITDLETLKTLPARELTAGWCECVKQGAVASRKLFKQTTDYLAKINGDGVLVSPELQSLIASHCEFKASIIAGDEQEDPARTDRRSRRVLNFGHTVAHALEQLTSYRRFRHGEAVGWGMLVAGELSKNVGLLDQSELELLRAGIHLCGPLPSATNIDSGAIVDAVREDKKSASGQVQWVLLEKIGRPRIVSNKEISKGLLKASLQSALSGK